MSSSIPISADRGRKWLDQLHHGLNHDFCPWANKWVYWLKHPFWIVLTAAFTAALCGLFVGPTVLAFGAALILILLLGVLWPWLSLRGVHGQIRFLHSRGRAGELVPVEIELTNLWPWPVWGLELARGFYRTPDEGANGVALSWIAGWSTTRLTWNFQPTLRGVYPLDTPQLESGFPFGLYRARRTLAVQNELIVWPRSIALDAMPDAVEIESREDRTSDRRAGDVGDMLGTRWFRQGDSLRRVHWAQSARQGRLIVCERQTPVSCALRIVLDLHPRHHADVGQINSLESLLSIAASLLESLHRQHATLECVIGRETLRIGRSAADLKWCLDALSRIPATGLAHDSPEVWGGLAKRRHRALAEYVLTTSRGYPVLRSQRLDSARFVVLNLPRWMPASDLSLTVTRPWMEPAAGDDLLKELPRHWRRACCVG